MTPDDIDTIKQFATEAMINNRGIQIIGARQNYHGYVVKITEKCLLLHDACVDFETGELDGETITTYQFPHENKIIVMIDAIESIVFGKKVRANSKKNKK